MELLNIATDIANYQWNNLSQPQLRKVAREQLSEEDSIFIRDFEAIRKDVSILAQAIRDFKPAAEMNSGTININVQANIGIKLLNPDYRGITPENFIQKVFEYYKKDETRNIFAAISRVLNEDKLYPVILGGISKSRDLPEGSSLLDVGRSKLIQYFESGVNDQKNSQALASQTDIDLLDTDQKNLRLRDELNEYIITPNMEFASPPKCNVFLPPSVTNYGMRRNHMEEPTRMLARMPILAEGVQEWYVAPFSQSFYYLTPDNLGKFSAALADYSKQFLTRFSARDIPK
jgi:hypothetical protein